MAHIIPTTKDFTTKEGVENYINATTIDFNQFDGSSLYAYLYGEAFRKGLDGSIVEEMYKRSCEYTDKHDQPIESWDTNAVYGRLMPMVYNIV